MLPGSKGVGRRGERPGGLVMCLALFLLAFLDRIWLLHNSAVLWNPWAEGAASMGDMQDDGYLTMLCVESTLHAPSLEAGKTLQPGESHQLITVISAQ